MDSTQDSTPWIPDSSYWIPNSLKVGLGFRIPIVRTIHDSLTCISDSTSKYFPDSGIWIPLHCTRGEIYLPLFPFLRPLLVCTWHHDGHVGSQEQKCFSPLRSKLHFWCKFFEKKFYCIEHQHSHLVTWFQAKNPLPFFVTASLPFKLK